MVLALQSYFTDERLEALRDNLIFADVDCIINDATNPTSMSRFIINFLNDYSWIIIVAKLYK